MGNGHEPTYALTAVQAHIVAGTFAIEPRALDGAWALSFDRYDIADCICELDDADFHKTMPALKKPGLMQDVYKTTYQGVRIYLKVQIHGTILRVVQFKQE